VGSNHKLAGLQALQDPVIAAHAEVSKAKVTLDDLISQQAALVSKELALKDERKQIGFDTFARKEEKSRQRLTKISQEHFLLESELDSIGAAIQEARKRLATAQEAERAEIQKAKAREILVRLEDLDNAAAGCDLALKAFLKSFADLEKHCAAICSATNHPQREILRTLARRAVQTALLSQVRLLDFGFLAPGERITFADMSAGWSRAASAWCAQRLGSELGILPDLDAAE
jgi:hypothetical protein